MRSHGRGTGDGPIRVTTTGTLPTGLPPDTDYWLIRVDQHTLKLALDPAAAGSGVAATFEDNGSGRAAILFPDLTVPLAGFDHLSDSMTVPRHARVTATGPVRLTTDGALPIGLEPDTPYWLIRIDAETLQLAASRADAFSGTAVGFGDNGFGAHRLSIIDQPRGVDVTQNRLHSHTAPGEENCTIFIRNAQDCSVTGNEIISHQPGPFTPAIRFVTEGGLRQPATGWNISGNRIRGDAGGGTFDNGVSVEPKVAPVIGVTISDNSFRGCAAQVRWNGPPGSYIEIPLAHGNTGAGTDFAELSNLEAVCISGSPGSTADYVYATDGLPTFAATDGSTARRRTGGGVGTTMFLREVGGWRGL
jgi:hypothetical protein